MERDTLAASTRTALVVGTILALLNHGAQLFSGRFTPDWLIPMALTYLVPFSVATYGQVRGKRQRDALRAAEASLASVSTPPATVLGEASEMTKASADPRCP